MSLPMSLRNILTAALISFVFLLGCSEKTPTPKKELLIYCGITMFKPMAEIAKTIEQKYDCRILITKGGSGNLLRSIKANKVGDLYLPGAESYIKTCLNEGLVTQTVHVGYNKAALMVQKGNPLNIKPTLDSLLDPDLYVVIGNPDSGSIGRETKKILTNCGSYEKIVRNARQLTTDSKDLISVLKNQEADLVVNWYATATWAENKEYVDALTLTKDCVTRKKLILGLLKHSEHPEIAKAFLEYAFSEKGKAIFNKYGLYKVQ